nr:GapA-binding peptide SR1P [Oceanobacillus damuensis]
MRQIVCQKCGKVIDYIESEKVDVLYGKCMQCPPAKKHNC